MIPTTNEKLTAALWESARVLNLILNDSPPADPLFGRARLAYDKATEALRDEGRDKLVREMNEPAPTGQINKPATAGQGMEGGA